MEQTVTVSKTVDAPPSAVWAVLTDLDAAPHTLRGVTAVERLDGPGDYTVGTRWRETRVMFGKESTEELRVVDVVPERRTVVTAESGGTVYRSVFTLTPHGTGTELHLEFSSRSGPLGAVRQVLMTLVGPLAGRVMQRALRQDLDDIAAAAQRQ